VEEHDAVQRSRRWIARRFVAACAAAGLLLGALAANAPADVPPDMSGSSLSCSDPDGGALRPGDEVKCVLIAAIVAGTDNATITATVALPATAAVDPLHPPPAYNSATRVITFGSSVLGLTFSGQSRLLTFYVDVADGVDAGTAITLGADLTATAASVTHATVSSDPVIVSPPPASLTDSAMGCSDANGGDLLPGEQVSCDLDVVNAAGVEDAAPVAANISLAGTSWVSGGTLGITGAAFFGLGTVAAGTDKPVTALFAVSPLALGGAVLTGFGSINAVSSPSGDVINLLRSSAPLVVSPGPAVLTASALRCDDSNGGLLLAGDDLTCTVTVSPAPGHESIQGTTGSVAIPAGGEWVSGGDSHDASTVAFDVPSLGDVAAGSSKAAGFHLRVVDGTAVGTVLRPIGSIAATSVPHGGAVQQALNGNFLTVGKAVPPPGAPPVLDEPVAIVTPPAVKPPVVAASKAYKLRAKTIKFVMRRGHKRKNHLWNGSRRRSAFVKKYVVRTPKTSGKVVKKVTVPKKGKWAPKRGKVTIKGTKLTYTLKKGVNPAKVKDRFRYTVTDTHGKKATGTVIVTHN
jgi:hypothetical protein